METLTVPAAGHPSCSAGDMVRIEAGEFLMGSDVHYPEEEPAPRMRVDGFVIDRYLVTNRQFAAFVGSGTLSVNGKPVAQRSLPETLPFIWAWDETFDVGLDTGTPVDDSDYQVPFPFTGKLEKITFDLGTSSVSPQSICAMMEEFAKKRDR